MKLALVHDYLTQAGGAERVVEALQEVWPDAPLFTSIYDPQGAPAAFHNRDIRTSFLQGWARHRIGHRLALPFYPLAFENFDLSAYDVVLSSSSAFAKGVLTPPETCHICYCHTPARFLWRYHDYMAHAGYPRSARRVAGLLLHWLRTWDVVSARRVDYFIANSHNVARRIRKYYGRPSFVLPPPVQTERFLLRGTPGPDAAFLLVARLIAYKRVDLAVAAFTQLGLPLRIIGAGPERDRLRAIAGPTITFLGPLDDNAVADEMGRCLALIFPGEEDFGIAPLEAMASGRPVLAYRGGGALETVLEGETGAFFDEASPESLAEAVHRFDPASFVPARLRAHAERFATAVFQRQMVALVAQCVADHRASVAQEPSDAEWVFAGGPGAAAFSSAPSERG